MGSDSVMYVSIPHAGTSKLGRRTPPSFASPALRDRRLCYLKTCKSVLYCRLFLSINTARGIPTFTLYHLPFTFFICPHYHEKLAGMKLLWKLLETIMLEMFKIIIDHNILLRPATNNLLYC